MNLFELATRGVDLASLPDEPAPRERIAFEPSANTGKFSVPSDLNAAFDAAANDFGIDPDVLRAVAFAESRFRPDIISGEKRSSAGAIGLMQFMPETADEYGINPTDPVESIFGAAAYLRKSLDKFGGDYGKAVASYNAGPNRKAFDAADWDQRMPAETQGYLRTVFTAADQLKQGGAATAKPTQAATAVPDTGDETARLAARYKAPDAPQQGGMIQAIGDFFKPAPTSVLESYKPTAAEQQAANAQRLRYGAGPIKGDVLVAANEVASGNANSSSPTVNTVAKQMQERGDTFTGYAQAKNTPILKEGARDAKAAEFRSAGEWAIDTASGIAQGTVTAAGMLPNVLAPSSELARNLKGVQQAWAEQESDVLKAQRAQLKARVDSEEGFAGKYAATVYELVTNPALGLSEAAKQVPNFLAVMAVSRLGAAAAGAGFVAAEKASPILALSNAIGGGAMKAGAQAAGATTGGLAASVVMTSGDAAGNVYDTLTDPVKTPKAVWEQNEDYQALIAQGVSHKEAVKQIASAKAQFAAMVVAPLGAFGFMGADAALATRGIAGLVRSYGPKAGAKTFAKEIGGENVEEMGTQYGGNVVARTVNPNIKLDEGVAEAGATATITSAPFAGYAAYGEARGGKGANDAQDPRSQLIAAGLLDPQTYNPSTIGADGTANPLLERMPRKPAPTVESQPTTPQAPTVPPAAPNGTATQAVDNIATLLKQTEANIDGTATQATPVQPGSQAVDAGAAPVAQGSADTSGGLAPAGEVVATGQSEQAVALTVPEKGSAVIPSVETGQSMAQRLTTKATPEQEQTQADTVVAEKTNPATAYTPAVPQPGQAEAIVGKAVESARKNSDLADERLYSPEALQRIAAHPQANDELKAAATNEIARREVVEQRKQQQFEARRSGTLLSVPDAPPLRPLSVERGMEIAKASRERKLLPQEQGYMDALKSEIGDQAFDLVTRAGKAPFMTTMTERKFDLPRLLEQNQSALSQWDGAHNPAQQPTEAPQAAPVAAPKVAGLAAEMTALKARSQPAVKMNIAPAMKVAQAPAVVPVVNQQMTTEAPVAPVAKQGKGKKAAQVVDAVAEEGGDKPKWWASQIGNATPAATHTAPDPYVQQLNSAVPSLAPDTNPSKETRRGANSIPTFQGGKTKMARAITDKVRQYFGGNAAKIDTIIDYFGGSGSWGAYMASSVFTNTKSLVIHEYNPERLSKIKLFNERGDKIASMLKNAKVVAFFDKIKKVIAEKETYSGSAIAGVVANREAYKKLIAEANAEIGADAMDGLLQAIEDQGQASFGLYGDGKTAESAVNDILRLVAMNGAQAHTQMSALRARGVSISYVTGDSYQAQQVPGKNVLAMVDPPYYATKGYNGVNKVPIETYNETRKLLDRLRTAGNSVIYTDEAWWEKHDKNGKTDVPADLNKHVDGLDAFGQLRGIQSLMGDFFRMPIASRMEVVGLIDGNQNAGTVTATTPTDARSDARRDVRQDARGMDTGTGQQASGNVAQGDVRVSQGQTPDTGIKASRAPSSVSRHAELLREWLRGMPDAIDRIIRRNRDANKFDYELRDVPVADITPSQSGEDYLNDSSRETARQIATTKSIEDIGRKEDVLPIVLDENLNIIDGNHRHAASTLNGAKTIPAIVRVGPGTGIINGVQAWVDGDTTVSGAGTKRSTTTTSPRTPASTIRTAITKAYGNILTRLEGKGLVSLTQTEEEAIAAAAQARADQTGGDVEAIKESLRKSVLASQRAWHGTPHRGIEKFSTDKIGTGEGAQAFGYGLYYADRQELAEGYRKKLSAATYDTPTGNKKHGEVWQSAFDAAYQTGGISNDIARRIANDVTQWIDEGRQAGTYLRSYSVTSTLEPGYKSAMGALKGVKKAQGQLYEVDIPNDSDMLLWDKPMSQQTEAVRDAIMPLLQAEADRRNAQRESLNAASPARLTHPVIGKLANKVVTVDDINGQAAYEAISKQFGGDRQASEHLAGLGVKGIKYLDGQSRYDGDGTYNYVVFSGDDVQIVDVKYSKDGNLEGFFDPATGKSFLIADNLTAESAPATLMHEVGIHMAADGKLEPVFDRAGNLLKMARDNEFIQRVQSRMDEAGETSNEEAAAYIVTEYERDRTNAPQSVGKWIKDFIADVRAWLFNKGVLLKADQLTVADIAAVARANANRMAAKERAAFQTQNVDAGQTDAYTPSNDSTQPTAEDQARVSKLGQVVARALNTSEPSSGPAYIAVSLPDAVALQSIGSAFGKRLIGFDLAQVLKGTGSEFSTVGGVSLSGVKDAIFISSSNDEPHLAVLGHELAHQMRLDEPTLYDDLVNAIRPYVNQNVYRTQFGKELVAAHLTDDNLIKEEFIGEVLSDGFMDAGFWNALGRESPTLLSRVFDSVKLLIDKASAALGISRKTEKYLTDFDKVMEVAGAAMARYGVDDGVSPSVRRSVRNNAPQPAQQNLALNTPSPAWMLPASTKTDALVYEIQDQKVDLKRTQEAIKAAGREITEPFDARMAETLMPGRVAYRTETFLKTEVAPLMEAMAKNNVTQNELSDYLLARHAPERNAQIAKVNPEMPDGGAGTNSAGVLMTTQAAQDHIAALTTGKRMVLQLLANKIDAITASTRDMLVREGLEKQSTMDAWTGAYKHYVPLFKDEAVESPAHPIGSGMSVTGSASKRAMGSEGEVTNMVAHILMQRESAITRAEKNRVAMSLYGLALSNPNQEVWTTIRPNMRADKIGAELAAMGVDPVEAEQGMQGVPTIRTVNAVTGLVQETPNPMYKRLENALVVKVDGEDRVILFNAKNADAMRMARALKNQDGLTNFDLAGSMVGTATRYFASINTQYNPAFGMVNVVRDVGGALVNLTTTDIADKKAKVLGDIPAAMKGIARDVRGDQARTPWSDLWVQFQEDGGRTGYRDLFIDPFKRAEAVQKDLDAMQRDGTASAGRVAHSILDLLDDFNTTLENGVRLSAYKAALDKGMSRPAAAKMARELTVDFNRKGRMGREIGPLYAFFNASVQGTARTVESLKGPAGKKIIAGGLMLGVIQSLMLAAAGFDDDEPPEFVKARAFIIPTGDKRYIAIPLQFGLNALPNTGRVITDLLLTGGKDAGKKTFNAIGEIMGSFNPLGGGNIFTAHGLLTTVAPTVADPLIDLATNTNFAGTPIGKDRADWDTRPGAKLARESTQRSLTGQAYIGISKAINAVSGGNEFKKGLASPTPEQVQYVFTTAGGGLYRELEKTLNIAGLKADGFEVKSRMIPLGGRFAGEADDQDTQRTRYFKNTERLSALEAELKGFEQAGDDANVDRIEKDKADEVDLLDDYKAIRRDITKLNKLAAENITDTEMLKELDAERLDLMRELNDSVRKLEKRSELFKRD